MPESELQKRAIAREYAEALQDGQFAVAHRIREANKDVEGWCEFVFLYHQPFGVKYRIPKRKKEEEVNDDKREAPGTETEGTQGTPSSESGS